MEPENPSELERLIDNALRSEPERDLPFGFHRSVVERLKIAALLDRELKRFRACWASAGLLAVALACSVLSVWLGADLPGAAARAVPGALGSYDRFILLLARHWPTMTLTSAGLLALLCGAYMAFARRLQARRSQLGRGKPSSPLIAFLRTLL